jgi:hypothetical protein
MSKPRNVRSSHRYKGGPRIRDSGIGITGLSLYWGRPRKVMPQNSEGNGPVRVIKPAALNQQDSDKKAQKEGLQQ